MEDRIPHSKTRDSQAKDSQAKDLPGNESLVHSLQPGSRNVLRVLACSGSLAGGGSERQLWQFVSRLDRSRFAPEVYLLARSGPYLQQLPTDVPVHAFDDDYRQPPSYHPGRITWLQSRHLQHIIRTRCIDVVYDRTFHMTLLTSLALPRRIPRISVIVSPPSRDLPSTERRFVPVKRWLLGRAYRRAAATLCVSHEVADDAAKYYRLSPSHLHVVPNPIDCQQVRQRASEPLPADAERLLQKSPNEIHVALIGRFTAEKGHQLALEVTALFMQLSSQVNSEPDRVLQLHMHFVGSGPLESTIAEGIGQLGLAQHVHLHGYQINPYPILSRCDVAFVPSTYEGFPNVALEALALGVPLLMTDYGTTARYIAGRNASRALLIPAGSVEAAVAAFIDRWRHPQAWAQRVEVGREWVEQLHAIEPWLATMARILEQASRFKRIVDINSSVESHSR